MVRHLFDLLGCLAPFAIVSTAFLFIIETALCQNATIQGHIKSIPLNHPTVNAKVVIKTTTGQRLDSVFTDQEGNYFKAFTFTGVDLFTGLPEGFFLKQNYPNPFNPSTKAELELPRAGTVAISVYTITGELVVGKKVSALAGLLSIDISGLRASGVYFMKVTMGARFSGTIKMVNLGSGSNPRLEISQLSTSPERSDVSAKTDLHVDSLDIELSKQGYVTNTRRIQFHTNTAYNADLEKIPRTTDFTLKPILITEDFDGPINSMALSVDADSQRTFTMQNGQIRVLFNDYNEVPKDSAKVYVTSSDKPLNPYIKIRRQNQPWGSSNLAQNTITAPYIPGNYTNMPDTTKISLALFNALGTHANLILEPADLEHPFIAGRRITTMSDTVRMILAQPRPQKTGSAQWRPNAQIDRVEFFQLGWNLTTGQPVSSADSAQIKGVIDTIMAENVAFWGDTLARFEYSYPLTLSDSKLQAAVARDNNYVYTAFQNVGPSNYYACLFPNTNIGYTGSSRYATAHTFGNKFTEVYQMVTGLGESNFTWPSGLGGYVVGPNGSLAKLGKYLMRVEWSSDIGTRRR